MSNQLIYQKVETKENKLWDKLIDYYPLLRESFLLTEKLKIIKPITYSYLVSFVDFYKNIDNKFCITAIHKTQDFVLASKDIAKCLNKREWLDLNMNFIYYVNYQFDKNYECPHGEEYKDVYLLFFTKCENEAIQLLEKFDKLKAFV